MVPDGRKKQREHRPADLGPRLEQRGRYWSADCRPWGGSRYTALRDPKHPRWPNAGDRTEDRDLADRWKWAYVDALRDASRRKLLNERQSAESLADAAKRFLDERERDVGRGLVEWNTFKTNRTAVNHLTENLVGTRPADRIETEDLQGIFNSLLDDGYKAATLHSYRFSLNVFFDWLGRSRDNPADDVRLPGIAKEDAHAWDDDQVEQLREAASALGGHARLALEVGLCTGAREQEIFALRGEDFIERDGVVRIQRQLVHHSDECKGLKGKRSRTTLILPAFEGWYPQRRGLVFARPDGRPLGSQGQRDLMEGILAKAKLDIPGVRWHALRHTYARTWIEMGARFEELQLWLGHTSISVTEGTYGHFRSDRASALARQRILGGGPVRLVG